MSERDAFAAAAEETAHRLRELAATADKNAQPTAELVAATFENFAARLRRDLS